MPAVSGGLPPLSEVRFWSVSHLFSLAADLEAKAERCEACFSEAYTVLSAPGWKGAFRDTTVERAAIAKTLVDGAADQLRETASTARRGAERIRAAKKYALEKVHEAEREGYEVGEDYSVTDTRRGGSEQQHAARAQQGAVLRADIRHRVALLVAADREVGEQVTAASAGLAEFGFPEDVPGTGGNQHADQASTPVPEDPKQFTDWWASLSPEQKDDVYSHDHDIGNHPGMPWDPKDHLGKDHYNQLHLSELQQHAQSEVDRLQHQADALARQAYMGDHDSAAQLSALAPQLAAAKHTLDGYKAVQADLNRNDGMKRYLGLIDDHGHAAISIGNPDTATRNAIFVPGTGQDLTAFAGSDAKAAAMYNAAHGADPSQTVAVTTWMGYDRPMNLPEAAWPDPARAGAGNLDSFESGLRASHVGPPSIDTIIGHSYGSTVVGAAASGGHHLDANNVIAVASPGMLVGHAGDLNLDPGSTVYATTARNDIIGLATDMTLGADPMASNFGAVRLWAAPGPSSDPFGITPSVDAHSSYWLPGNPALDNLGAVIAGVPPPQVIGPGGEVAHR